MNDSMEDFVEAPMEVTSVEAFISMKDNCMKASTTSAKASITPMKSSMIMEVFAEVT